MTETRQKRAQQGGHDHPLELEPMWDLDPAAAGHSVCFAFP